MGRLQWGSGTPIILPRHLIRCLARAIKPVIPPADPFEFSVEFDPTLVDAATFTCGPVASRWRSNRGPMRAESNQKSLIWLGTTYTSRPARANVIT